MSQKLRTKPPLPILLGAGFSRAVAKIPTTNELLDKALKQLKASAKEKRRRVSYEEYLRFLTVLEKLRKGRKLEDIEHLLRFLHTLDTYSKLLEYFDVSKCGIFRGVRIKTLSNCASEALDHVRIIIHREIGQGMRNIDVKVKECFLNLLDRIMKDREIHIFTLNYDELIETLCQERRWSVVDGFEQGKYIGEWRKVEREVIFLYHIHGALSWLKGYNGVVEKTDRSVMRRILEIIDQRREEIPHELEKAIERVILYPGEPLESAYSLPFLDILFCFREILDSSEILLVVGYSFRDKHINYEISTWLRKGNVNMKVVDPKLNKREIIDRLGTPEAEGRIDVCNKTFEKFIENPENVYRWLWRP